jgi:hypothetical protein
MQSVDKTGWRQVPRSLFLAAAVMLLCEARASALDLFASHRVEVQFATSDGKPLADAEVRVYAPGDLQHVVRTGRTDAEGRFEFPADRDGLWSAEARTATEVARASIRVGGGKGEAGKTDDKTASYILVGALVVLLGVGIALRRLGRRARRR